MELKNNGWRGPQFLLNISVLVVLSSAACDRNRAITPHKGGPPATSPVPTLVWQPEGPAPNTLGQVENVPNSEVTGAIEAVTIDPTDANVVYIGAVNGGIWKSTNATSATPSWIALTDDAESPSISALELDPLDKQHKTLLAGFGIFSSYGFGVVLDGVLFSNDGGKTWRTIPAKGLLQDVSVTGLAPRGGIYVVSNNVTGILRGDIAGTHLDRVSGSVSSHLPEGPAYDLVGDPQNPAILFTNGGRHGIYRSDNTGLTWTKISNTNVDALLATADNVRMSVGTSENLYVAITRGGQLSGLYRASNWGQNWAALDLPSTVESGRTFGIHPGKQGATNLSIAADPRNSNIVYLGGDCQPCSNQASDCRPESVWPNSLGAMDFTGRLFRVDATQPRGKQASAITHANTASHSAPHADSRRLRFAPDGTLIETDDGGIYRRTIPDKNTGDWFSANGNLQITELHSAAWDSNVHMIIGGAQDTGTPEQEVRDGSKWESVSTSDGGVVAVDDKSSPGKSIRYWSAYSLLNFSRRVCDAKNVCESDVEPKYMVLNGGSPLVPQFYTPIELNSIEPSRMIIAGRNSVYESTDQADSVIEIGKGIRANETGPIAFGAKGNVNLLYVGSDSRVFVRKSAYPDPLSQSTAYLGQQVMGIAIDPSDMSSAVVVDTANVYVTPDQGGHWQTATGNLSSLSPGTLMSIVFVTDPNIHGLVVGSTKGVYFANASNYTNWIKLGSGLPAATVMHVKYNLEDDVLLAATLGRGAWILRLSKPISP
jgi:photosystem II stability/assembly factor-like uncharacterized protein